MITSAKNVAALVLLFAVAALPAVALAQDPPFDPSSRLANKLLIKTTFGPDCKRFPKPFCTGPLANTRIKVRNLNGVLIRSAVTNAKGMVYITFPNGSYKMAISHAPINGRTMASRTYPVKAPFFGNNGVSEFRLFFCIAAVSYDC